MHLSVCRTNPNSSLNKQINTLQLLEILSNNEQQINTCIFEICRHLNESIQTSQYSLAFFLWDLLSTEFVVQCTSHTPPYSGLSCSLAGRSHCLFKSTCLCRKGKVCKQAGQAAVGQIRPPFTKPVYEL